MIDSHLGDDALLAMQAGAWLGCGALIGACHFSMLRWSVRLLAMGRAPVLTLSLQLARFAVLAGALAVVVSRFGALPLLLATAGIVATRFAAIRMGEQP